ncbi:MAG: hypothetical protein ACREME_03455, partial [Gemmatimonadales bacterium]
VVDSGCAVFPANESASEIEYLLVPQLTSGVPGHTASFRLRGDTVLPAPPPPEPAPLSGALASASPAAAFHGFLRQGDERRWWGFAPVQGPLPSPAGPQPAAAAGPPVMNERRVFQVCSDIKCSKTFTRVVARVRALRTKVAIFVDSLAPANGLDSAALDSLAELFDTRLYAVDTAAFGRESDIDANTVVMVLMTRVVNKLVTREQCETSGFVAGFFLGADIDPAFQNDPRSNRGEVFYSLVADPAGDVSCAHSAAQVQRIVPITFIHEFQHMISYNQHALVRGGNGEVLWLNEGLSHYAEELGGRTYVSGSAEFSRFTIGNFFNAYEYLDATRDHFLAPTAGIGSLPERGAAWLFVRYLVDRYAGDTKVTSWNTFTRSLVETSQTGAQNIAAVTGDAFGVIVSRWALANWVSDLPGFSAPPELEYDSWNLRAVYASLNVQDPDAFPKAFPLTPTASAGDATNLTGTLRAGSGVYHRAMQPVGDPGFATLLSTRGGQLLGAATAPRLGVIRIR